ncbi:uncharacterized protein BN541_03786 [Bacteroides ovatus CAG:22]|nr:uncharacterized protein BN541_03786 [Bacteroides ovatus CAG:22]
MDVEKIVTVYAWDSDAIPSIYLGWGRGPSPKEYPVTICIG